MREIEEIRERLEKYLKALDTGYDDLSFHDVITTEAWVDALEWVLEIQGDHTN